MILLMASVFLAGGGIGACFSFLSQQIMAAAREGEGDAAASAIPTTQLVGLAIGAGLAGVVANASGFSVGLDAATAAGAAAWVPSVFLMATLFAAALASRAEQMKRQLTSRKT